jgi:hypothetical protein
MSRPWNPGRVAGLLYLITAIPGPFSLVYVPGKLIVQGNAAATASRILAHESLFRAGMLGEVVNAIAFLFAVRAVYGLLRGVNERLASLMETLFAISIPISCLNVLNSVAALALLNGSSLVGAVGAAQREAAAMMFLSLHGTGVQMASIFWGLWLLPFGLLAIRSGFIPKVLGALLIVNGFAYPLVALVSLIAPEYVVAVNRGGLIAELGELWMMLWLVIHGATPPRPIAVAARA